MTTIAAKLSLLLQARTNCGKLGNKEWFARHEAAAHEICKNGPSGSGIDQGTKLDVACSDADKLVFIVAFHHMNEVGYYDGWTEHTIRVYPAFQGVRLTISGEDRDEIKDYLHDVYYTWLTSEYKS